MVMETVWQDIGIVLAANLGVTMGAVLLLWLVSIPLRDVSIIDMAFAMILLAVTVVTWTMTDGAQPRKNLILLLVALWAIRITAHLVRRNWGHGEDPRYTKLRSWVADDRAFIWLSLRQVFLLQGVVLWLVSLPVQVGQIYRVPAELGVPAALGTAVWLLGFVFETVADRQLARFRADPANKGKVLDTGLWRYSRHPNYFGELCVWWGLFLVACDNPWGLMTIIGPIGYTHLIVNVTGQRTLDKKLARDKPGYREYMERTSGLIPVPPRRAKTGGGDVS
jgi:steroid 5-alpha reductase family enzyme